MPHIQCYFGLFWMLRKRFTRTDLGLLKPQIPNELTFIKKGLPAWLLGRGAHAIGVAAKAAGGRRRASASAERQLQFGPNFATMTPVRFRKRSLSRPHCIARGRRYTVCDRAPALGPIWWDLPLWYRQVAPNNRTCGMARERENMVWNLKAPSGLRQTAFQGPQDRISSAGPHRWAIWVKDTVDGRFINPRPPKTSLAPRSTAAGLRQQRHPTEPGGMTPLSMPVGSCPSATIFKDGIRQ